MWFKMYVICTYVVTAYLFLQAEAAEETPPRMITNKNTDYYGFMTKFNGLNCDASGTNLKFSWKHGDVPITERYTLKFPKINSSTLQPLKENLNINYEGNYQCFAENSIGKIFGRLTKVTFTEIGKFTDDAKLVPKIQDVTIGTWFGLHCPKHGKSYNVKYSWQHTVAGEGLRLSFSANYFVSKNGTLYFAAMSQQDIDMVNHNGGVQCVQKATDFEETKSQVSRRVKLRTKFAPVSANYKPVIRTEIGTHSVFFGEKEVVLKCGATGKPVPKLKWYKENKPNKRREITNGQGFSLSSYNQILIVRDITDNKAGDYVCEATNYLGTDKNEGKITVASRPQWKVGGEIGDVEPAVDSRFVWECAALGGASYDWFRNGNLLSKSSDSGRKYEINNENDISQLIFPKITEELNGMYQCTATNEKDTIYSAGRLKAKLKAPEFVEEMGPVTLILSRQGLIACPVDGGPVPTVTWRKDGGRIQYDNRIKLADNNRDLIINNVTDADKGQYTCEATNSQGEDSRSSDVTVGSDIKVVDAPVDNRNVTIELKFELDCHAVGDPSYEVKYRWLRNGQPLDYSARIHWVKDDHRLIVLDSLVSDTGTYTCIAYAETPLYIEQRRDAAIVVKAPANPPAIVRVLGDCWKASGPDSDGSAQLQWVPGALNNEEVYYYIIEWSTTYSPNNWTQLPRVLVQDAPDYKHALPFNNLPPFSQLSFRVIVVNRIGPSEPSPPTDPSRCLTQPTAPPDPPGEIKAEASGARKLTLVWTPVPQMYWGAAGFNYSLQFRRKDSDTSEERWNRLPRSQNIRIYDGAKNSFEVKNPGYYNEWEFRIRSNNHLGSSRKWIGGFGFSGQDAPKDEPAGLVPGTVSARSAEISWKKVTPPENGSIAGYRIKYWYSVVGVDISYEHHTRQKRSDDEEEEEEATNPCYKRDEPCTQDEPEKESRLDDLAPYKTYHVQVAAYNSGGVGPYSEELTFDTAEDTPGPPYAVFTYAYGRFCKVTWKIPRHPNGKILEYEILGKEITNQRLPWWMRRHILFNLKYEHTYFLNIRARTKAGWGDAVERWFMTSEKQNLSQPLQPEVVGYGENGVNVTFMEPKPILLRKFGGEIDEDPWEYRPVGGFENEHRGRGAYPEEFYVVYRRANTLDKWEKSEKKMMYSERDQTWVIIENLQPFMLYEFATVPINDKVEGPWSKISYGLPGGIVPRVEKLHWYQRDWFIALAVLFGAAVLLFLVLLCSTHHVKAIYYEGAPKRRKDREKEKIYEPEDVDGGFNEFTLKSARSSRSVVTSRSGPPPAYSVTNGSMSRHSGDFDEDLDSDEDDEKHEVSTYYSDEKKVPLDSLDDDEEEDSRFATFV